MKVSIIGSGNVGSNLAHRLTEDEVAKEIVLLDIKPGIAKGSALDINHSANLTNSSSQVIGTDNYEKTKNSDIIVITAGAPRDKNDSRIDLIKKNKKIIKDILRNIKEYSRNPIRITVTNPVDVMNWFVKKETGARRRKVIGMGGVLDSSRFSYYLAKNKNVSVSQINGLVIGSHSSEMVPLPKKTSINGVPLSEVLEKSHIKQAIEKTKRGGDKVINQRESSAYFAPSFALKSMIESILYDKKLIYPVSIYLKGEYGFENISLGVPARLGKNGAEKIFELNLSQNKVAELEKSAKYVEKSIKKIE